MCVYDDSTDGAVMCASHPLVNETDTVREEQPLAVRLTLGDGRAPEVTGTFTYKADPVIEEIYPLETIPR